ncbi:sperm acrosome developmental regulator isoform X2 [Macrotis lagotis]|uniref:sperm acrosome developmental regulator isoform X2 n=1 Tax=Macrotis lagotis TaxID=92651 RepID=UPI003D69F83A
MGCLRFQVFLERVKNQKAKQKDPKGRGHWQSASVLSPYQLLALSTPLFSWVLYSRGLDMCLSWLYHLWEEFKLLFFHWTRPTLQLSTLVIPGSKEKVLKPMGASKRVVKENVKAQSRTLLQMPQTAIYNVTSFMESFLHFGRKFSMGKVLKVPPFTLCLPDDIITPPTQQEAAPEEQTSKPNPLQ